MSPRLSDTAKWMWCVVVLNSGQFWSPVSSVTVPSHPQVPATIETQAKFFQYRHLPTAEDFDQGHRLGSDNHYIERHERSRPASGQFSAKVRWGDKQGGYGEHYWDLNHAVHAGNQKDYDDSDDGSYHKEPDEDYRESDEREPLEKNEIVEKNNAKNYKPDNIRYEEIERIKREGNIETTTSGTLEIQEVENLDEESNKNKKSKEHKNFKIEDFFDELPTGPRKIIIKRRVIEQNDKEDPQKRDKNHVVLIINQRQREEQDRKQSEPKRFVPYEKGAGIRQHLPPEIADTSIPRLFIEPSTGHVIDRTTGHAYMLQPLPHTE